MFGSVAGDGGRWSRRAFLTGASPPQTRVEAGLLTPALYLEWIRDYRAGRFVETARKVWEQPAEDLRDVQRAALESLPPQRDPDGFLSRLAAGALHAEAVARYGWNSSSDVRLLRAPARSLPDRWIIGLPPSLPADLRAAWGDRAASDPRRVLFREVALAAARPRLGIMGLADATHVLDGATTAEDDPVLRWQLAVVWAFRARYVRERDLWAHVRRILTSDARRAPPPPDPSAAARSPVARAMSDPDDRNLRLALALLGMNRRSQAEEVLARVPEEAWAPLRVPRRLLEGETLMARSRFGQAAETLGAAVSEAPGSQPVAAAYVAALQAAGRWDEAAELARDRLSGTLARGFSLEEHPWLSFLTTWVRPDGGELAWLRSVVAV